MAETSPTTVVEKHPCPECGGDLQWNAAKQALVCPYCGTIVPCAQGKEPEPGAGVVEQDLETALRDPAVGRGWGGDASSAKNMEKREVKCQSCRAISIFVGGKVATRCDFCGSPAIIAHETNHEAITPQSLLAFKVSEGQVRDSLRKWYGSRWFAPNKLKSAALTDTLRGVYLPYWTFDARVKAHWRAEAGHYYNESETYRDDKGETQTREVQRTRWVPAAGHLSHFFDDELVPGTTGVHADLLRQIEPFPTLTDLKPYSPEFVRGWTVERYQIDLHKAEKLNQEDMQKKIKALCSRQVPGDTQRNLQVEATYQGRTFKHILVPIWLVSYTYGSRNFQVVANGYTGAIAGEQPYSWIKITFAVLAVLLLAILVMSLKK